MGKTPSDDGYAALRMASEMFEDIQRTRIAIFNRVKHAPIDAELIEPRLVGLRHTERELAVFMRALMREACPEIVAWQARTVGIGEGFLARLLGQIGHPVLTTVHAWEGTGASRELVVVGMKQRRVSDLWQYCGHGDSTRRLRRGMSFEEAASAGNPRAKMIVWNMATNCVGWDGKPDKNGNRRPLSPYRLVYEARRQVTAERLHATPCIRCGPSGHPALEGTPWSKAHQYADALRVVGKEILRDLWAVASDT